MNGMLSPPRHSRLGFASTRIPARVWVCVSAAWLCVVVLSPAHKDPAAAFLFQSLKRQCRGEGAGEQWLVHCTSDSLNFNIVVRLVHQSPCYYSYIPNPQESRHKSHKVTNVSLISFSHLLVEWSAISECNILANTYTNVSFADQSHASNQRPTQMHCFNQPWQALATIPQVCLWAVSVTSHHPLSGYSILFHYHFYSHLSVLCHLTMK